MAISKRHLIRFLSLTLLCAASLTTSLLGQTQPEKQVLFRTLAVGNDAAFSGLFYDYKGKPVALNAGSNNLSTLLPSPPNGRLSLYRQTPPPAPGEPPGKVPVTEVLIGKEGPYLILLASTPNTIPPLNRKVIPLVVDESVETHPLLAIRLFNFSKRRIAVQINSDAAELATADSHIFTPPPVTPMIPFKVATQESSAWELRLSSQTPIIEQTRSIVVITDIEPTPERPNPVDIMTTTVFDDRPPPAKAKP
jgi:hypothetical protein